MSHTSSYLDPTARTLPNYARRAAADYGSAVLAAFPDGGVTYADVVTRMESFAGALQALDVSPGDRVAVLMQNRSEWLEVWFGTCALGAIEVPINHHLKGRLLAHCLADCGAAIAIVEDAFLETVMRVLGDATNVTTIIVVGEKPARAPEGVSLLSYSSLPRRKPAFPEVRLGDPACIMYTSGTTASPKGVVLPHNYFLHFGEQKARHMRTTAADRIYNVYPMFNVAGQCETIMAAMAVGASTYTAPRFSASGFWDDIRSQHCTEFIYMGGILSILAKADPSPDDHDNPLRAGYGIPTPPHLHRDFEERFGVKLVELYGSTEANIVTYNPYDERRVGSCGLPTAGFEVRVVDEDDNEVPNGTPGEIIVRPTLQYTMMTEYWNLPQKTVEAWKGGWYRSGDLLQRDADGYLSFVSRRTEAIRHRGHMINPSVIEAVLNEHEGVLEAAVIGIPEEFGEDDLKAFIVANGTAPGLDELIDLCARELPPWMVPRFWEIRDALPKSATLKVAKTQLRDEGVTPSTVDLGQLVRSTIRASSQRATT